MTDPKGDDCPERVQEIQAEYVGRTNGPALNRANQDGEETVPESAVTKPVERSSEPVIPKTTTTLQEEHVHRRESQTAAEKSGGT